MEESLGQRRCFQYFTLGALAAPLDFALVLCRTTRVNLGRLQRGRCFGDATFGFLYGGAQRVRRRHRFRARAFSRGQLRTKCEELGATPQWAGAARAPGKPDGAARVDKCGTIVHRVRVTEQCANPALAGDSRVHAM